MGYLKDTGFIVTFIIHESKPLRRYQKDQDPVYEDSAAEVFLSFEEKEPKHYLNFEMNSYGAMLAEFGVKGQRLPLDKVTEDKAECKAKLYRDFWTLQLMIPKEIICELFHKEAIHIGDTFTCNFYKISQERSCEHYASYSPIDAPAPDFHLPLYFSKAVICDTI